MFEPISAIAKELAYDDFPKKEDIIAIVRMESNFIPEARNRVSIGVMQVNHGPKAVRANMEAGVSLLREYYLLLGSVRAAVISYNIGPGNFLKKRSMVTGKKYFQDFQKYRRIYEKHYSETEAIQVPEPGSTYTIDRSDWGPGLQPGETSEYSDSGV